MAALPFGQYLTTTGLPHTSEAELNAIGNYSTDTDLKLICPDGEYRKLKTLTLVINDGGSVAQDTYGDGISLSDPEGILIIYKKDGIEHDITDRLSIKTNFEWNKVALSSVRESADSDILTVKFDFEEQFIDLLHLNPGDEIIARHRGDFSGLQYNTYFVTGNRTVVSS